MPAATMLGARSRHSPRTAPLAVSIATGSSTSACPAIANWFSASGERWSSAALSHSEYAAISAPVTTAMRVAGRRRGDQEGDEGDSREAAQERHLVVAPLEQEVPARVAERGAEDEDEGCRGHGRAYCMTAAREAIAPRPEAGASDRGCCGR